MPKPEENSPPPKYLQQNEESQECCKDLFSTLPRERGWVGFDLYKYQGFWLNDMQVEATIACQQHFQAKDDDVLLVTAPKSGTTWLKALVFALANRKLYPPISQQHPLLTENSHELVPFLELDLYLDNKIPDLSSFTSSPRLFSTHLPYALLPKSVHSSACKLVYLCRDPKDTLISLWHFSNKIRLQNVGSKTLEDALDMFCRGVNDFGPFWDHVLSYWKQSLENPGKVLFMKYEEMKKQPIHQLKRLAAFLGHPFSMEEEESGAMDDILRLCSFDNLSNLEVNKNGKLSSMGIAHQAYFRRGEVGDWKNYLTPQMMDRLDSITEQKFNGSGLKI